MKTNTASVLTYLALSAIAPMSLSNDAPLILRLIPISVVNPVNAWLTPYVLILSATIYIVSIRRFEKI